MPIDPVIINAARVAIHDELEWAAADEVNPWASVETLHTHRFTSRLEQLGWHGHPETHYDHKTPGRKSPKLKWNRADLYAARAVEEVRLYAEVKRLGFSADGRRAGDGRYSAREMKLDWARDLHRLLVGPQDYPGWTTWRLFYLVARGVTDPALFTGLPTGPARDTGDRIVSDGLAEAVRGMEVNVTALDLLTGLIDMARDHGLDVEPVLPAPLDCDGEGYWYPLMFGWSTTG